MKKAITLLSFVLLCSATATVSAQRPTTTKTVSSTRLAKITETAERVESYALDASYEMFVTPVVADIKLIDADASGACKHRYFLGDKRSDGKSGKQYTVPKHNLDEEIDILRSQVIFDFCRETDADVIVMPQFSIRHARYTKNGVDADGNAYSMGDPIEDNGRYVMEVEMLGFPAVYTKFRPATAGDVWIKKTLLEKPKDNEEKIAVREDVIKKQKE